MFVVNMAVLYWIKQLKEYKPFVNDRKTEILKLTSAEQCQSASELKVNRLWHEGPEFLRSAPENWSEFLSKAMVRSDEDVLCEIKGYKTAVETSAVMQVNVKNLDVNLKAIIDANRYGDLGEFLRVTSYCLRFLHNLKCKHHKKELLTGLITSQEIGDAECLGYWKCKQMF